MAADPLIAHYIRRLTFGPRAGQLERLSKLGPQRALDELLVAAPTPPPPPVFGTDDDYGELLRWYLDLMRSDTADLHERMVWFWHGHLTSGLSRVEPEMMHRQQLLLRKHALGNLRDLLTAITTDAAMLLWLDGNGSRADAPNENYARELMELFALGRGNYTEVDVRAGAYALAGWHIDYDDNLLVKFDQRNAPTRAVEFLGRPVQSVAEVVDAVCDHPACAPWITAKLFAFFVGRSPEPAETERLATVLRSADFELRPLVEAIVRDPAFAAAAEPDTLRPKSPVEWFLAAERLLGTKFPDWYLDALGQRPLSPPNVAGWPGDDLMLSASSAMSRAQFAFDGAAFSPQPVRTDDPIDEVTAGLGLPPLSTQTLAALTAAIKRASDATAKGTVVRALIACSPEFCLH